MDEVMDAARGWPLRTVAPGEVVITAGDEEAALAIVRDGELEVRVRGHRVGVVGPGDVVGEMGLFAGATRSATVVARSTTHLLMLDWHRYQDLRQTGHPVASAVEERALSSMCARLRDLGSRIAELTISSREESGLASRSWSLWPGGWRSHAVVNPAAQIAGSVLFAGTPVSLHPRVAHYFQVVAAGRGSVVATAGASSTSFVLLTAGQIELRGPVPRTLAEGDAYGVADLVTPASTYAGDIVVQHDATALRLSADAWLAVRQQPDLVGSSVRLALIRAAADEMVFHNTRLATLAAEGTW